MDGVMNGNVVVVAAAAVGWEVLAQRRVDGDCHHWLSVSPERKHDENDRADSSRFGSVPHQVGANNPTLNR